MISHLSAMLGPQDMLYKDVAFFEQNVVPYDCIPNT